MHYRLQPTNRNNSAEHRGLLRISSFTMSEYQPRYFQTQTEGEKNCADPDIFWRKKHQYAPQYEQHDR